MDQQQVSARLEVEDLLAAYTRLGDSGRLAEMSRLFAPDGELDVDGSVQVGPPAILAFLEDTATRFATITGLLPGGHHVASRWIELTGGTTAESGSRFVFVGVNGPTTGGPTATLAVDLPGREGVPGDLRTTTIADGVASLVEQIEQAGLDRVVLVGHSLAGLTVPGVATALGADRLVMVACCVPAQGQTVIDTLAGPLRTIARRSAAGQRRPGTMPWPIASFFFCNGMSPEQKAVVRDQVCAESVRPVTEPVDRSGLPDTIPRTWVRPLRDRSLRRRQQLQFMANLGGVRDVVEIDACHDVMVSHPDELAAVLSSRCRAQ